MLKLIEIERFKDGTANYIWDASDSFLSFYKKETNKSEVIEKEVSQFIKNQIFSIFDGESTLKKDIKEENKK